MSKYKERFDKIDKLLKDKNINFQQVVELQIEKYHLLQKIKEDPITQYYNDRNGSGQSPLNAHR